MATNIILEQALALSRQGCPVFPVGRDKKPLVKDWPQVATCDEGRIRGWCKTPTPPNIGLLTGDKSGLFVLDVDGPAGLKSLRELEAHYGATGCAHLARTPSGGLRPAQLRWEAGRRAGHPGQRRLCAGPAKPGRKP